jgi:hypothetical protein
MRLAAVAGAAILIGVLAGCATTAPPQAGTASPTPVTTPASVDGQSVEDQVQDSPALDVQPWEQTAQDALDTAVDVVSIYLNPASPTWWSDLAGHLSPQALTVYEAVDPVVVPAGQVTGEPTVTSEHDGTLVTVRVPTSVGDLDVLLTRGTTQDGGWEVEQIVPVSAS